MALPSYAYGDPANIIERREIHVMGCAACVHSVVHLSKRACLTGYRFPLCQEDHEKGFRLAYEHGGEAPRGQHGRRRS